MSQADKPTDLEMRELLAFELGLHTLHYQGAVVRSEMESKWRSDSDTRKLWRDKAQSFLLNLESSGITIRIKRSATTTKALKELMTIPEQPAYTLGDS